MAMIVDALFSQFIETLAMVAKEEVTMLLGAKDARQQLEKDARTFIDFIRDAERRAFTDPTVRGWLADIKNFVYDADDIIDYSRTRAEKLSSDHPVRLFSPLLLCCRRLALNHRTGNRIRRLNGDLESMRKRFPLNPIDPASRGNSSSSRNQQPSDFLVEPYIVGTGIEKDTSHFVDLITSNSSMSTLVLAITGMGGVGKTALAQNIYNNPSIKGSFIMPPPIWVWVSREYDKKNLLEVIIRGAEGDPGRGESFPELQGRLARAIEGKKFFLVLDDVWDARVWVDFLQKSLQNGAAGSTVLITTRDDSVAKKMGAKEMHIHRVRPLTTDESWSLLCKMVFPDGGIGDGGDVGEIGRQIAEKCGGLPLAIKSIAGVLRTKPITHSEWEMVLRNPAWSLEEHPDGVMGVLYLSYQDLPFPLRQCFNFCSLFPDGYVYMRHTLIQLWVAEGFITEKGELIREEIAHNYYRELLARNLLIPDPQCYDDERCTMHDLLRSLGQSLTRDEYLVGDVKQIEKTSNTPSSSVKLRHLLIVDRELGAVPQVLKYHESLRTLLIMDTPDKVPPNVLQHVTEDLLDKLGCLRVLDLSWVDVKSLSQSVGNLIHLRYLNISRSSMVELPETVGELSNLQYLILQNCRNLNKLPRAIAMLYKLRSLDLEGTSVVGLPAGIGRLKDLNRLIGFVTNEDKNGGWCSLEEIRSLSQLRTLTLASLEGALVRDELEPRGFLLKDKDQDKDKMMHLELCCQPYRADRQPFGIKETQKIKEIFERELVPPSSLEIFKLNGFFGSGFPSWLVNISNLRRLDLVNCEHCELLPPLGQLPNLDLLNIKGANLVASIGPDDFMVPQPSSPYTAFPRLRTLNLEDMQHLEQWQWEADDSVVAMPCLEVLKLAYCPKLSSLPGGLRSVKTLNTLSIEDADSLSVIQNFDSLKTLHVLRNNSLEKVSNLPALQNMVINSCYKLRQVGGLNSLQSLEIQNLQKSSLPAWMLLEGGQPAFPSLKSLLYIVSSPFVLEKCKKGGTDWPKIQHIPQVQTGLHGH